MPNYPNPFDFVPFPATSIVRTEQEFDALGEKYSGYLELELKALTPVHVVGKVEGDPDAHHSFMYHQDGQPCIPASSIRGCLRAFVEALTAGWASQATPEYKKEYHNRHVGFRTFEEYLNDRPSVHHRVSPPAVNPAFKPGAGEGKLDVASYLFGVVAEGEQAQSGERAQKSKVLVEDAYLAPDAVNRADYWMPDLEGSPFMGGAKPSASAWWYFRPAEVWRRNLPNGGSVAEFVGEQFRGRKFYYHQDPLACVQKYHPDSNTWRYVDHRFHPVRLDCMETDKTTLPFRIYLDGVPVPFFWLLMRVLRPGVTIRHKLGFAKAYGYGSIEFTLRSTNLRTDSVGIPSALQRGNVNVGAWSEASLTAAKLTDFVDRNALGWLSRILGWPHQGLLFMYPQYRANEFKQPVQYAQYTQRIEPNVRGRDTQAVSPKEARAIAEALFELKRPIDFRLYQERAEGWATIVQRRP